MQTLSTFDVIKEPLHDLLQDVTTGKIQLIDFQRSWCWDEPRVKKIIASVSLGFPIGSIMILRQGNPNVNFNYRPVEGVSKNNLDSPVGLLTDGQQRITSLWMNLISEQPVLIDRGKRYSPDKKFFYLDIEASLNYPNIPRDDAIISLNANKKLRVKGEPIIDFSTPEKEFQLGLFPVSQVFYFIEWRSKYIKYWNSDREKEEKLKKFESKVIKQF